MQNKLGFLTDVPSFSLSFCFYSIWKIRNFDAVVSSVVVGSRRNLEPLMTVSLTGGHALHLKL